MAVLGNSQVQREWVNNASDRTALYALSNVTAGDTVDLGPGAIGDFLRLKQAVVLGTTVAGTVTASVSGTVVTIPAGLSNDAGYLLAWGGSA